MCIFVVRDATNEEQVGDFLQTHHIQGRITHTSAFGLVRDETLVGVMTFSNPSIAKSRGSRIELSRFCTSVPVVGGASRLLRAWRRDNPQQGLLSYADLRWSQGDLYRKLGFTLVNDTPRPSYWYVVGDRRIHRFALRKNTQGGDQTNLSERENRLRQGWDWIYDCGHLTFHLDP